MRGRRFLAVSFLLLLVTTFATLPLSRESAALLAQGPARSDDETDRLYRELAGQVRDIEREGEVLVKVARIVSPTVVHIQATKQRETGTYFRGPVEETGSGVIVKVGDPPSLYVLTNRHVVEGAQAGAISIHLSDARVIHPTRVWEDQPSDVALLQIPVSDVSYARLGDSEKLQIGSRVLAAGSPFGLSRSITHGIISARGRRNLPFGGGRSVVNQDFLQTDAAINPGNSGGPLVNLYGEVVGINTAIASNSGGNEGIGFSIPINLVKTVVNRILEDGKVERGFLGVVLLEASEFGASRAAELGLERPRGALVVRVSPNTPASRADMRPGDVVLEFNGVEIEDQAHLINLVSLARIGEKAALVIWRNQRRMTIEVVLGDRESLQQQVRASEEGIFDRLDSLQRQGGRSRIEPLGLTVVRLTPEVRSELGFPEQTTGVVVAGVDPLGPVGYRILPFDVIDQVERTPVQSVDDLEKAVRELFVKDGMVVRVRRRQGDEEIVQRLVVRPKGE